jgi:hypothetical protein
MNKGETMKDKKLKPFEKIMEDARKSRELYLLRESFTMIIDMLLEEDEKVNTMPSGTLKDEFLKIQKSAWTALLRDKDFQKITTEE